MLYKSDKERYDKTALQAFMHPGITILFYYISAYAYSERSTRFNKCKISSILIFRHFQHDVNKTSTT